VASDNTYEVEVTLPASEFIKEDRPVTATEVLAFHGNLFKLFIQTFPLIKYYHKQHKAHSYSKIYRRGCLPSFLLFTMLMKMFLAIVNDNFKKNS